MKFLLLLPFVFVLDLMLVAWFRRLKQGKFDVTLAAPSLYRFETDLGQFQINTVHGRFDFKARHKSRHWLLTDVVHGEFDVDPKNKTGHWALSDLDRIEFNSAKNHAILEELLFGYSPTDLFERYRDTVDYFVITVHCKNGSRLPVYIASQYKQRDFLSGWYIRLQEVLLERLGLFKKGYNHSMAAYMQLREVFAASGIRSGSA